jgi:FolB domain-containing protein
MDKIIIKNLLVRGIIGIYPEERANRQAILINLTLYTDIRQVAVSENIAHTLNYKAITDRVVAHVEQSANLLVEKLATDVARLILTEFDVTRVRVRLEKPGALHFAESVGVEIERTREDFDRVTK